MQLSDLRKTARGEYLGLYTDDEDEQFSNALLNQFFNDAHRELAFTSRLYRVTKQLDVAVGVDGFSGVGLGADVCDVELDTVRLTDGTRETPLLYREEAWLLKHFGLPRNRANGTPRYYYLRNGAELTQQRGIVLYPGSEVARPGALLVGCWIYPALMTDDTDTPAFQPPEHQWLVAQVKAKMAEVDANLGRSDAPVVLQEGKAQAAGAKLEQANRRARRGGRGRRDRGGW